MLLLFKTFKHLTRTNNIYQLLMLAFTNYYD